MRGILICFEGLDRTGKSTQVQLTKEFIENQLLKPTVVIRLPDRTTPIGQQINSFLQGTSNLSIELSHLLFSANRWELKDKIEKLINQGVNVILDRYSYSGIAYSMARGLEYQWCSAPENGLPKPDIIFYLTANDQEKLFQRGEFGNEIFEVPELQRKVKQMYENNLIEDDWIVINALENIEFVQTEIRKKITIVINNFDNHPLRKIFSKK